jgi:divalent metal cation (Fe/Co/Zn/Cd) transporter
MIETVLAFLAGWFLSWPALAVLVGAGVLFEHWESTGMVVFLTIVTAVTAFFFFDVTLVQLAICGVIYLAIGILWSFWRYRRYVRKEVAERINSGSRVTDVWLARISPLSNTDTIVGWVVVWPFSAIENLAGDLINGITELVTTTFRRMYASIYEAATKDVRQQYEDEASRAAVRDRS